MQNGRPRALSEPIRGTFHPSPPSSQDILRSAGTLRSPSRSRSSSVSSKSTLDTIPEDQPSYTKQIAQADAESRWMVIQRLEEDIRDRLQEINVRLEEMQELRETLVGEVESMRKTMRWLVVHQELPAALR
ncbi:hypothetical protein K466DRAFT_592295 [Polyporus arcularius HHB13444]|uniref:Uncharacterized protein n=1 Tax=Polyporus arcularius HHB13444 TaxID=1314778 RepID=A0A5C3NUH8_9APHY|nr:hypothetical protein K466DRAFT_592295 [Polyporus arcularius HHB13444]